jgi:enoyl-CoA hydratase/carnithine racemase
MPMAGGVQRIADRIGRTRAALYAMLTLPMSGEMAGELGLASFVSSRCGHQAGVAGADAVMLDVGLPLRAAADAARGHATEKSSSRLRGPKHIARSGLFDSSSPAWMVIHRPERLPPETGTVRV